MGRKASGISDNNKRNVKKVSKLRTMAHQRANSYISGNCTETYLPWLISSTIITPEVVSVIFATAYATV
ncbi:hypothetical protein SAMN05444266_11561 [Chitinophaga jiangningensis]|uniref:Uncharacterized protein n=1 Tax=Chitinophaga jiangningensis TaxID=1419482 RepID=A0A1M7MZ82_9BACT|nr:hypothetical protein SAMN05444266_11561 [Chitinophaga jiangningensis]